jgi:hypothetical protein
MQKPSKPSEDIGSVPLNSSLSSNGQAYGGSMKDGKFAPNASAQLVREQDPGSAIVVHAVRRAEPVRPPKAT